MDDPILSPEFEEKVRAAADVPRPEAGFVAGLREELIARASQASQSSRRNFRNRLQGTLSCGIGLAALGALVALLVFSFSLIPGNGADPILGGPAEEDSTVVPTVQFTPTGGTWPTAEFTPTAVTTPPYLLGDPASLHPLLGELYTLIQRRKDKMLGASGWLHQSFQHQYAEGAGTLPNGAQIPSEYVMDHWSYLDGQGTMAAMVTRMVELDGQALQASVYRDGVWRNLTFGTENWYELRPADFDLDYGFFEGAVLSVKSGEGWISKQAQYDDGQYTGDLYVLEDSQGLRSEALFDPQTGQLRWLKNSVMNSGKFELIASATVLIEERASEPPAEVLALLNQEPAPYQPLPPQGTPASPGFDPSQSELRMEMIFGDDVDRPSFFYGDLYADEYLLGRVDFGARPGGNCDRSADGTKLGFTYEVIENETLAKASLRWLDLRAIETVHDPLPELMVQNPVTWAPQGERLAFSACTGTARSTCGVYVLSTDSGEARLVIGEVRSLLPILWKPDGSQLAISYGTGESPWLLIVEVETGQEVYEGSFEDMKAPPDSPLNEWGVDFPRGMTSFGRCEKPPASAQANKPSANTEPSPTNNMGQDFSYSLAWSPKGNLLAVGSLTGLRLYDVVTAQPVATIIEGDGCCGEIVFRDSLLAAINGSWARVWDVSTYQQLFSLEEGDNNFQSIAVSPDGQLVATGERERIRVWRIAGGVLLATLPVDGFVPNLAFTHDGTKLIATVQWKALLQEWDLESLQLVQSYEIPRDVLSFTFSEDATTMMVDYGEPGFELWDLTTFEKRHDYGKIIGASGFTRISPDNNLVAVWGYNTSNGNTAAIWNLRDETPIREFTRGGELLNSEWKSMEFSPDGKTIAISDDQGAIHFFEILTGNETGEIHLPFKFPVR